MFVVQLLVYRDSVLPELAMFKLFTCGRILKLIGRFRLGKEEDAMDVTLADAERDVVQELEIQSV